MYQQACQKMYSAIIVLPVLCVLFGTAIAQKKDNAAAHLQPQHRAVVERWLVERTKFRLAIDGDYVDKSFVAAERESFENYHPYYLVADFNGDKKDDFALALVDTQKRTKKFAIVVFNGPVGDESVPALFREGFDLRRMAFTAAEGIEVEGRTSLFVENPNTGKGWVLRRSRKGYVLMPSQNDFN